MSCGETARIRPASGPRPARVRRASGPDLDESASGRPSCLCNNVCRLRTNDTCTSRGDKEIVFVLTVDTRS